MQIVRHRSSTGTATPGLLIQGQLRGNFPAQYSTLSDLLRLRSGELRSLCESVQALSPEQQSAPALLAPIDGDTEVWAAGVTYKRSMSARVEESETPDIYTRVYSAPRPELFFKATPRRVAGPEIPIIVRTDSSWDVPEPELALVINAYGEIVGYTIANDVSSRSIEGENPLYLPQAKVYAGCCALGPGITPAWEIADPYQLAIQMTIEREGQIHWQGQTNTSELKRRLDELVAYLFREDDFPCGAILCTGTALVPDSPFTLQQGDTVQISIDQLGSLRNPVLRGKQS
ncbi:fumarylacetoacetate hydrolase [Ktedonosporobacter rubrisoli]|uniref:Fumarylacetoacetate hydrolase n=1 Tax=Ktedonosporobacter rubrisoli TaxID=2509675 RepID=A0A4P6K0N8_KTERU|nr:fumarylacetoacetate hydrolase family protein [Ktedonosporobacter rubrisoli]QBD81619.1 fumarylacetoacetate hydrolase [Ktedonosporobacter rubrisoli]